MRFSEKVKAEIKKEGREELGHECREWAKNNDVRTPTGSPPPWETMRDTTDKETNQQE